MWNTLFAIMNEFYVVDLMATMGELRDAESVYSAPVQVLLLVLLFVYHVLVFAIVHEHLVGGTLEQMSDSVGILYENVDTDRWITAHYTSLMLIRRLVFAMIIVLAEP